MSLRDKLSNIAEILRNGGRITVNINLVNIDRQQSEQTIDTILKVKRTEEAKEFPLISIAKDGDVGMDLPAVLPSTDRFYIGSITINPGERGVIPTGISLEIPNGYWASIEARSSTSKKMLIVPKGVIDEGYRGELFAVLLNVGSAPVTIEHGDRYVQLILHKRHVADFIIEEVDELSKSERGDTGFGSSGQSSQVK